MSRLSIYVLTDSLLLYNSNCPFQDAFFRFAVIKIAGKAGNYDVSKLAVIRKDQVVIIQLGQDGIVKFAKRNVS